MKDLLIKIYKLLLQDGINSKKEARDFILDYLEDGTNHLCPPDEVGCNKETDCRKCWKDYIR